MLVIDGDKPDDADNNMVTGYPPDGHRRCHHSPHSANISIPASNSPIRCQALARRYFQVMGVSATTAEIGR
jgi:hypothetical protein